MKQKENWGKSRAIGKYRFITLTGSSWAGIVFIIMTLMELWPNGKFIKFGDFLTKAVIFYIIGGFLFGLLTWLICEYGYKKGINKSDSNA